MFLQEFNGQNLGYPDNIRGYFRGIDGSFFPPTINPTLRNLTGKTSGLVEVGTVSRPISPNPLESSAWLGQTFGTSNNFYELNPSGLLYASSGCVALYMNWTAPDEGTEEIFNFFNSNNTRYLVFKVTSAGAVSFDYTNSAGANVNGDSAGSQFIVGRNYIIRAEWGPFGVRFLKNGVSIVSNATVWDPYGPGLVPKTFVIGTRKNLGTRSLQSKINSFMISSDPSTPFPLNGNPLYQAPTM